MFRNILFVALGGSLGSIFRYLFSLLLPFKKFPFATFSVNIIGSFFIGLFMGYVSKQIHNQSWQLLLIVGVCGGFTTFSTFSWDIILMLQEQRFGTAIFYIFSTIFLGILFAYLGFIVKTY